MVERFLFWLNHHISPILLSFDISLDFSLSHTRIRMFSFYTLKTHHIASLKLKKYTLILINICKALSMERYFAVYLISPLHIGLSHLPPHFPFYRSEVIFFCHHFSFVSVDNFFIKFLYFFFAFRSGRSENSNFRSHFIETHIFMFTAQNYYLTFQKTIFDTR